MPPDAWARANRVYSETTGWPGPRDPSVTPYVVPFGRAVWEGEYRRYVLVTAAQSGKTDEVLDLIGARLDQRPAPIIYAGPTREFLTDQFEPRLMELLDQAGTLARKVARGRTMKKTLKRVAGVRVRLAHAGSSAALKSDPAALAFVDEYDEMTRNVKGQGDVLGLIEARGETYADFVTVITSTPSVGLTETERDPATGLEFWKVSDPEGIESPIWRLFQQGTRHHFAWPCAHCGEFFIPRLQLLRWPERSTPAQARRDAHIACPHCGGVLTDDEHKAGMNARGVLIAPGQRIEDGRVVGAPRESSTWSQWVSGLCSPFVSWGMRAERFLLALESGDPDQVQTAVNAGFGELYAPGLGGDVPEWQEVREKALPYRTGEVPREVLRVVAGIDVQKHSLYYVIRGFGWRGSSWLVDYGQLYGPTDEEGVWADLTTLLLTPVAGLQIEKAFIDSGFRPNKADGGDEHKVYEYCRRMGWLAWPTKGHDTLVQPYRVAKIEVTPKGKKATYSINLVHLSTDFFKSLVMSGVRTPPGEAGSLHVPEDVTEDYCRQIVSEYRTIGEKGRPEWVLRARHNHFLDCFDPETELLTSEGWISVADVTEAHSLATVDLETDEIEYQRPVGLVAHWYSGKMVEIDGRVINALVTPNHRMVTYRRNPVDRVARITRAEDLTIWHTIKRTAKWRGRTMSTVELPAVDVVFGNNRRIFEPPRQVDAGDWFEFLGWFVSGGHTRKQSVVISQSPGEKHDRIAALLRRLDLPFRVSGGRQFVIRSRQAFEAVRDCLGPGETRGSYRMRVPHLVKTASPDLIDRFLEAAVLGDGWEQRGARAYATVSRQLADDLQELFIKAGATANIVRRSAKPHNMGGQLSFNTVDQFHVSECRTPAAHLRRSDNSPLFREVEYEGMVYCATVPNGTLIARRRGKPMVVGNCEALAAAAAYSLNVQRIPQGVVRSVEGAPAAGPAGSADRSPDAATEEQSPPRPAPPAPTRHAGGAPTRSRFAGMAARMNR